MPRNIEELKAHIEELRASIVSLDSEFPNQELPPEKRSEWDRIEGERESDEALLGELEYRAERVSELGSREENREPVGVGLHTRRAGATRTEDIWDTSTIRSSVSGPEEATRELRDRAMRAIEIVDFPHERADREVVQAQVERLLKRDDQYGSIAKRMLDTGSPMYGRAFGKSILGQALSPEEARALSLTGSAGGFAVPFQLDPTIIFTSSGVVNPIRQVARVEQMTVDTWKGVSSAGTTAAYSGEAEETEEAAFTFEQPEVSTERASTLILASFEITQDWGSIQSEIARAIQDAKDVLEAEKFLTGSGTKEPFGVLTGAVETVLTAEKEKFAVADVYALKSALPPRFRPNAVWMANDSIYDRVRQFDTSGGANMWVNIGDGRPASLLGKPAYELSTMNSEIKENKLNAIYGDFNYYLIAERIGMSIEVIPHVMVGKKATGQRGFYAFWRNGAKVLTKAAFRVLKGHT